jgi:hypothetical protein
MLGYQMDFKISVILKVQKNFFINQQLFILIEFARHKMKDLFKFGAFLQNFFLVKWPLLLFIK